MTGRTDKALLAQMPDIIAMAKNGYSLTDIAVLTKQDISQIVSYLRDFNVTYSEIKKQSLLENLKLVEQGKEHIFRVRKKFGFTPTSFYSSLSHMGQVDIFNKEVPLNRFNQHDLEQALQSEGDTRINPLILQGRDSEEIANELGVSRQNIDMYIKGIGAYTIWKERREELKRKEKQIDLNEKRVEFLTALKEYASQRATISEGDTPETKAEKTLAKRLLFKNGGRQFEERSRILSLFKEYFTAQERGEKLSFEELSQKSGYAHAMVAKHHINSSGLVSLYWEIDNSLRLTNKELKLLKKRKKTNFTVKDLKYFTGMKVTPGAIYHHSPSSRPLSPISIYNNDSGHGLSQAVSYSELSQLYEAIDRKFTREELPILFPRLLEESIDLAIAERKIHEPVIIEGLRTLYPQQDIQHPYTNLGGSFKRPRTRRK